VFDASVVSRVVANIARDPRVALIVRWPDETVLQVQGRADVPGGLMRDSCREAYFRAVPEARDRASSPEITHLRVVVDWLRPAAIPPR